MGLPQHNEEHLTDRGLTTAYSLDEKLNDVVQMYNAIINPSTSVIKTYTDTLVGVRCKTLIQLLISFYALKIASKAMLVRHSTRNNVFIGKAVDGMYNAGYLVKVPVARNIKPFNRHKIDTHYSLSEKGVKTVRDYVLEVLSGLPGFGKDGLEKR